MPRLIDEQGRVLRLGDKLGEGGEGAVYRLAGHDSLAVKVYTAPLTAERAQKISILSLWNRQAVDRFAAWPSGLVLDEHRRPRGLLLPAVKGGWDVHHLYTPSSRRQNFPSANWRFLLHVSTNIARAFATVHDQGLVIGDVNPGSILVLADGTVRLIDVDSFQVPVPGASPLLCTVAVPLFLPPELRGAPLSSTVRTPDHDAFGLAVTLFQLLMLGRHPYAGRYLGSGEMPIERAIAEHRFAYGNGAASLEMQRPPNTVGMEILSPAVGALFEAAFAPTAGRVPRPTAGSWVQALSAMAANLAQCGANTTHQYAREVPSCPWCTFEQNTSVLLFGVAAPATTSRFEAEYRHLLRLVAEVPRAAPARPAASSTPVAASPDAVRARKPPAWAWIAYACGVLLMLAGVPLMPAGLLIMLGGAAVAGVAWKRTNARRKVWAERYRQVRDQHAAVAGELDQANRFPMHAAAYAAVERAKASWESVPRLREQRTRKLMNNRRQSQLEQFLARQRIESAAIPGIAAGRLAMLSSYGIDTALDVVAARVGAVPSFGPKLTERLVTWRRKLEQSFVFNASTPLPPEALARMEQDLNAVQRQAVQQLQQALRQLQAAAAKEPQAAARIARSVTTAARALRQAEADVTAATGRLPA
ncbi:hypothetical protein KZZ52_01850 [Dactylosporangium sp. AC04546]|uniref:helix-hairpin-helix domain-containing protein n=1 Tax=Dactylosporangium sp. AC04546 TaxID=2862460 RepID=UPI002E7AFD33|nr:hypothetical protein [Dactylosporangium sp. AC04546]WVK84202.1 hypothetical protein KZZ52_01850 [Dactylosporangium sp. AC04546]